MNDDDYALIYLSDNIPLKITEVKVIDGFNPDKEFLDGIVDELFANNSNGDSLEYLGKAALVLNHLRKVLPKGIEGPQGEKIKEAVKSSFSKDFSSNIPMIEYLRILKDPSIQKISFESYKTSHITYTDQRLGLDHFYVIDNKDGLSISMYADKRYWQLYYPKKDNLIMKISMENKEIPSFQPSKSIMENIGLIDKPWPYPLRSGLSHEYIDDYILGAAIARYLPNIKWDKIDHFRKGEFSTSMWTLFLSVLDKHSILNDSINIFGKYGPRKLRRITQAFETPHKEFTLEIGNDFNEDKDPYYHGKPDMRFSYDDPYTLPRLYIDRIGSYKKDTGDGIRIDPHAF